MLLYVIEEALGSPSCNLNRDALRKLAVLLGACAKAGGAKYGTYLIERPDVDNLKHQGDHACRETPRNHAHHGHHLDSRIQLEAIW